jgi:transcriptional regulator with XRE-family HTH domain
MKRRFYFHIKLREILTHKGITQKELAEMTNIREATISEIANNSRNVINKIHLAKIMDALNVTKLEDILVMTTEEEY